MTVKRSTSSVCSPSCNLKLLLLFSLFFLSDCFILRHNPNFTLSSYYYTYYETLSRCSRIDKSMLFGHEPPSSVDTTTYHNLNQKTNVLADDELRRLIRNCGNNCEEVIMLTSEHIFHEENLLNASSKLSSSYKKSICKALQVLGRNKRWMEVYNMYNQYNNFYCKDENSLDLDILEKTEICRCAISALGISGKSQEAIKLLYNFLDDNNLRSFSSIEEISDVTKAKSLIVSRGILYNSAIASCKRSGAWETAINLLRESESYIRKYQQMSQTTQSGYFQSTLRAGYEAGLTVLAQNKKYSESIELLKTSTFIDINLCNMVLFACNKAGNHTAALSVLDDMMTSITQKGETKSNICCHPNMNSLELVASVCGKNGAWEYAARIESMMKKPTEEWEQYYFSWKTKNSYSHPSSLSIVLDTTEDYYWFYTGLRKKGKGKKIWWELANICDIDGRKIVSIGINSHKNPRRYGQSLLFFDNNGSKLGFMLIKNSIKKSFEGTVDNQRECSALVGMFVDPAHRGKGLSSLFLSIWLRFCKELKVDPSSEVINKPLLALVLHKHGFYPDKGGSVVEVSPLRHNPHLDRNDYSRSSTVLYSPQNQRSLNGLFSFGELKKQNLIISLIPPTPRGDIIHVKTTYQYQQSEQQNNIIDQAIARFGVWKASASIEDIYTSFFGVASKC